MSPSRVSDSRTSHSVTPATPPHFSCGTGGDWVFEGEVVTFADVVAAWTRVHGDGGWQLQHVDLYLIFVVCFVMLEM